MRKHLVVAMFLLVFPSVLMGQTKLDTKWHCGKATTDKSVEVGDVAGHTYGVAQGDCTANPSSIGEKTGTFTEFQEVRKASFNSRGRFVVTTDGGDKMYHTYEATGDLTKKTVAEKWKLVGGTGKYKGAAGTGTCSGKLNDDGTSEWTCSGTINVGK